MGWMFRNRSFGDDASWAEADHLIGLLRLWGVGYLVGENAPLNPEDYATDQAFTTTFIRRLARCGYPRVRDASISLFLLHPELVPSILQAMQTSEEVVSEQIPVLVLATLYLQRLWSLRLSVALGHAPSFPEEPFAPLWQSRHLPPPAYHHGKWGLLALQEYLQELSGMPIAFLGDWQNQLDHLFLQEEAKPAYTPVSISEAHRSFFADLLEVEHASAGTEIRTPPTMNQARIEQFLRNFGRSFGRPGRLSLLGAGALIHMGLRPGATYDIDMAVEADNDEGHREMYKIIWDLMEQMKLHIDIVVPGEEIPLPSEEKRQLHVIGCYGQVEVSYFDFYSSTLRKMLRSNDRDIKDFQLLVQKNIITVEGLDAAYQEVQPQVGKAPYYRVNSQRFAARYAFLRQQLVWDTYNRREYSGPKSR